LVSQCIWNDELIIRADDFTRVVWFGLLTGPQVTSLPGLIIGDELSFSTFLRRDPVTIRETFHELVRLERIEVDTFYKVIRVINAPRHNPPQNPNVVTGWWKTWKNLPESELKYHHVESLRSAVPTDNRNIVSTWNHTFGSLGDEYLLGVPKPFDTGSRTVSPSGSGSGTRNKNKREDSENSVFDPSSGCDPNLGSTEGAQLSLDVDQGGVVADIFEHYLAESVKHSKLGRRPILDGKRSAMIRARLREFTEAELKLAIDGLWSSDWHIQNGYTGIEHVLRDTGKVEQFLARSSAPTPSRPPPRRDSVAPPDFVRDISGPWHVEGQRKPRVPLPELPAVNTAPKDKPQA
jgi:hypothetical protein